MDNIFTKEELETMLARCVKSRKGVLSAGLPCQGVTDDLATMESAVEGLLAWYEYRGALRKGA